jgi:hypothetical protein
MHSTMSKCHQVRARCSLPFLGITKDMMFQGPQVADMEYQEADEQAGAPIIPHITIQSMEETSTTPNLATKDEISCFMR